MFFEKQNEVSDERTLSQLITGLHWGRNKTVIFDDFTNRP